MGRSDSFMRQLSSNEGWKSASKRWVGGGDEMMMKKRVMVVVDQSSHSKHAMMWALTHVTNNSDILTLLHIFTFLPHLPLFARLPGLSNFWSIYAMKMCDEIVRFDGCLKVEVEALAIQGPKMDTVMSQVKKLEVSVLVLGQRHPSPFLNCMFVRSSEDEFVEKCINSLECLTIGVKKQSNGVTGYLITTRWHKNFWLLA